MMRVSQILSVLAGLAGVAQANLSLVKDLEHGLDITSGHISSTAHLAPLSLQLGTNLKDEILFDGICQPKTATSAAVHLGLNLQAAVVTGEVDLSITDNFLLHPTVRLSLAEVKAYVELDLDASAAVYEHVELFASPKLELGLGPLLAAEVDVAFALDLVVRVDAALKVSAGFTVEFGADAYVEVNLLDKSIVDVNLDGIVATAKPIAVCEEIDSAITLNVGLRLRTQLGLEAGLDVAGLDLSAGLEAKADIWLNLFDYTAVILSTSSCTISAKEAFAITLGVALELDVEALDILNIDLAPTAFVKIASGPINAHVCLPSLGQCGNFLDCPPHHQPTTSMSSIVTTPVPTSRPAITMPANSSTPTNIHQTTTTGGLVTSVITTTKTYTITSCAATVPNCPADFTQKVITSTVIEKTTVCPATMTGDFASPTATAGAGTMPPITRTKITISACQPTTSHFTSPATSVVRPTPTVVMVSDSTTIGPTAGASMSKPAPIGVQSTTAGPQSSSFVVTQLTPPASASSMYATPTSAVTPSTLAMCPGSPECPSSTVNTGIPGSASSAPTMSFASSPISITPMATPTPSQHMAAGSTIHMCLGMAALPAMLAAFF